MSNSFCDRMWTRHREAFEAFWEHPFLVGLRDGTVPGEAVLHYVGHDHQYLNAYLRCYGLGISLSPDRGWVSFFRDQIDFLLHDETHPHRVMCAANDVTYEAVQAQHLAPSAQAYVDHMLRCGHDSLGALMASLLPCPWTYIWAGRRALREDLVEPGNPYRGWWEFYASPECAALLDDEIARVDALAAAAGPVELGRMENAFELSLRHEVRFWQMAWTRETWELVPQPATR